MSEKGLFVGVTRHTAHADELGELTLDELGLDPSLSDYKAALKRIRSLFDAAKF